MVSPEPFMINLDFEPLLVTLHLLQAPGRGPMDRESADQARQPSCLVTRRESAQSLAVPVVLLSFPRPSLFLSLNTHLSPSLLSLPISMSNVVYLITVRASLILRSELDDCVRVFPTLTDRSSSLPRCSLAGCQPT